MINCRNNMKKIFIVLLIASSSISLAIQETWHEGIQEKLERAAIMEGIATINNDFVRISGGKGSSPSLKSAIIQFLKRINTPLSYKIYREMVASGQLK